MDLPVCEEGARVSYDRDAFGSAYSSLEDEIIDALPKSDGQVYTPYTCTLFDIQADGTAATDIEHIVALAEAYDSGLAESQFRTFAGDIDNLTIADPTVNRRQKSDLDAGEWEPPENRGWFAARIVAVKQKYGLSVNPDERDALQAMLNSAPSRTVSCGDGLTSGGPTYYFPHLAVGEGWQTTITYINYSPQEVTCQTDFISDDGTPLMVSFEALGTVVSRTDVLPPGGSVHQETNVDLNASLAPGWARATCSGPVQASLLYRLHNSEGAPTAEAGVNATAVPATRFVTFAEQGEDQFGTGVAYANPSAISVPVTFTARDTGLGRCWPASFGHCHPEATPLTACRSCLISPALPDRSKSPPRSPSSVCRSISKPPPYFPPCLRGNWMLPRRDRLRITSLILPWERVGKPRLPISITPRRR